MTQFREYLGDSVYVRVDGFGSVILTIEDGTRATNTIVLEPQVIQAFAQWLERVIKETA